MASRGSLFSQTLLDITNTKLEELAKGRAAFEEHSQKIHALARDRDEPIESLTAMAEAIRASFAALAPDSRGVQGSTRDARLQTDLKNLDRFLVQAKYDPSVSDEALDQNIRGLLRHFEVQSHKFEYASLYAQLTTEWLSVEQEFASAKTGEDMEDDEYVRVSKRAESRSAWERSVFEESVIDQSALTQMLRGLFEATPDDSRHLPNALNALRQRVGDFERSLASPTRLLGELDWVISGLLASDLLSDEKRDVLRDFQNNPIVLREIADVLEMRLLRFQDWSWGREVLLEERRQMNGTYKIYMHEDLLQAILLQYIGVKWSAFWKTALTRFRQSRGVWKSSGKPMSTGDRQRRDYFLGPTRRGRSVVSRRERLYRTHYFLTHLRGDEGGATHTEEGEQEANLGIAAGPAQQAAPVAGKSRQKTQKSNMMVQQPTASLFGGGGGPLFSSAGGSGQGFNNEYDKAAGDHGDDEEYESPMASKQRLLHLLSTDILIQTRLQGGLSCFRSQIEDLFPSLPHGTIECVLRYLGVSQPWLNFFKRFLQAPLKFASDPSAGPRQRKTGTPGSHVLSEMFAEVVLFCLDFQINQTVDGQILWRMQDDFWFWSPDHELCVRTWSTIEHFLKHAGLKVNRDISGSARILRQPGSPYGVVSADAGDVLPRGEIRWGMLRLDPGSGRFEIDQRVVDQHIDEISRQLKEKRNSVFAWIQAWNSYAATFFTFNFGKPANCFGRPHVDNMLATHGRIQRRVFSKSCDMDDNDVEGAAAPTPTMRGSVIQYIKRTISRRFGIHDIPDGYFYLPAELGGLEVRSPFVHLLQIRDGVRGDDPGKLLDEFEEAEKDAYRRAKQRFDSDKAGVFGQQHRANPNLPPGPSNRETFFSWDEFIKYREEEPYGYTNELADVYATLLQQPEPQGIEMNQNGDISTALGGLKGLGDCPILPAWRQMEPYWKWVVQFYGPAMIDRFGGFQIVDPGLLPMGMVSLLRSGRVKWHE